MIIKVGISGGIGSGKSMICDLFSTFDIPIYNADKEAKKLMVSDPLLIENISKLFGKEAYLNGILNRKYISQQVFGNQPLLNKLNQLVHPSVFAHLESWFDEQSSPYGLYESALIFQGESAKFLDVVIYVYASSEIRISRVMKRDNIPKSKVIDRMNNQPDPVFSVQKADFVILNEGQPLIPQVLAIHGVLMN